ncbi:MAG: hypothetical protein IPF53_13250 [Blastocatellia bacterium]|jgi:hypothetical protein|nr:hypothetical protein [Blastocatellia bacterium]MBK6425794.1 hypothetical protein [Blastocatellia bacterium]
MNPWLHRAVEHLAPRIGRVTASNAVTLAVRKMGIATDAVRREDLPDIARNVSTILRVFLGSEAAAQLEEEIAGLEVEE